MHRSETYSPASFLVLVMLLAACSGPAAPAFSTSVPSPTAATTAPTAEATSTSARGTGDTLTLLFFQAQTMLNPHLSSRTKDLSASRITYEPVASFNKDGLMVPLLAAEIPSVENGGVAADGRSVTWRLKPDLR